MAKRESVPDKTSKEQKKVDAKPMADEKIRRSIGKGIIKSMSAFVNVFNDNQKELAKITKANLKETQQGLLDVFSGPIKESDLLANIQDFKSYLKESGESVEQFGKKARMSEGRIKALNDTINNYEKSVKELDTREKALKKAGLVVEQEIVDDKLTLKVLTNAEIRDKQRDIINKRKEIEDEEKRILKLAKQKDEEGRLSEETKKQIELTTQNIELLNEQIIDIKDKGVKEVKTVLTGFAGAIVDSYTEVKNKISEVSDAFLPGPIAQVFSSLVQAVEGLVNQVLDLFKPITATIGAIIKAPRFIAKKFFNKTDEEVDMMFKPLKDFGKKVGSFLLKPFKVVGNYMKEMFLRPFKLVALAFTKLAGVMKKLLLGLSVFQLKILIIVGIFALLGVAIFMFGKKILELGKFIIAKVKPVFQKIIDVMDPIVKAIAGAFNKLIEAVKAVYNFFNRKATDESRQKKKEEAVDDGKVGKVKQQSKNQLIAAIQKTEKGKKQYKNRNSLRRFDLEQLRQIGEEVGVDSKILERAKSDQALISSVESEKDLMKQKVKFSEQTTKDFIGLGKERSFGNIMKILSKDNEGANDLRERLKNNKQFQDLQRQKAEFDAQQGAMTGQGTTSNVASNITTNQTAGVYGKSPTRDNYAPYVDVNAMSYR